MGSNHEVDLILAKVLYATVVHFPHGSTCDKYIVRFSVGVDTKTFAVVGDLLTTSLSAGAVPYSKHTIQSQEQHSNISLQTLNTLELDLHPFPTDAAHFFLNDQ